MRRLFFTLIFTVIAVSMGAVVFALEVPLEYVESNGMDVYSYGNASAMASYEMPEGDWKLPDTNAEKPFYAQIELGDNKHLAVLDRKGDEKGRFDRMYIDRNGDGDLTDETPIDGTLRDMGMSISNYFMVEFPVVDLTITVDGVEMPYRIKPEISGQINEDITRSYARMRMRILSSYKANIVLNGKSYHIIVSDGNGNGRYNDPPEIIEARNSSGVSSFFSRGDRFFIAENEITDFYDAMSLGEYLYVGDTLYTVMIDTAKRVLTLIKVGDGLAPLKLPANPNRLSLLAADKEMIVMAVDLNSDTIMVPEGSYQLLDYQIYRNDEQGDRWRLIANGTLDGDTVKVSAGENATLNFGEPYKPTVRRVRTSGALDHALGFSVIGSCNEVVNYLGHIEGSNTKFKLSEVKSREMHPKEPSYRIIKSDGEIIAKGSFEYG